MQGFLKALEIALRLLLPSSIAEGIIYRLTRSKDILKDILKGIPGGVYLLKLIKVILGIITFPIIFFIACIKIILIWGLPRYITANLRYAIHFVLYPDLCQKNLPFRLVMKRQYLFWKLIINGRECRTSFGDKNPDKVFYVCRPYYYLDQNEFSTTISNLLFHYYRNLAHLSYALKKGWIPVVDWEHYGKMPHMEEYPINGTQNGWEYFWNQPSQYTLEEVYQSKNVILGMQNTHDYGIIPSVAIKPPFQQYIQNIIRLCPRYDQTIQFNDISLQFFKKWESCLFQHDMRVLGVSIRGMAYGNPQNFGERAQGHPKQPKLLKFMKTIEARMEKWALDNIFICCESEAVVDILKEHYQDQLLYLPRMRYKKPPTVEDDPLYEDGRRYQTNLEYLAEIYLLSKCTSLLAGMSSGVRAAAIWNAGNYEHIEIFDEGNF